MSKLLLMSFILATIVIPARAARDSNSQRGLKKAIKQMIGFQLFYAFALIFLWGRC